MHDEEFLESVFPELTYKEPKYRKAELTKEEREDFLWRIKVERMNFDRVISAVKERQEERKKNEEKKGVNSSMEKQREHKDAMLRRCNESS
jgi:hypothetical protein